MHGGQRRHITGAIKKIKTINAAFCLRLTKSIIVWHDIEPVKLHLVLSVCVFS